ncbi:TetR/AcrR family transcriptional regulator [Oceanobacillus neutriphilus]|uniref:TetR family transcriptional regulator n=1 Tax=Oceanobacillus neutriphilus TaxID=531815 RepID=A0ABQ2NXH4_9BACI|nr:TetR/AcrR family transcriptional regulator [Oceanobacillus neutriphilus]GGP13083.1 TetR family transcriptional regulator [Oceanobacillus neutriphilus]
MDGFERRTSMKKEMILNTSTTLFQKDGIKKVSISKIAKEANVSQVTIYNYFESKEKLLYEALIYFVNQTWEKYHKLIEEPISYEEKMKQFIFSEAQTVNGLHEEFSNYMMDQYKIPGNFIEHLYQEKALPAMMQLVQQGRDEGFIDPGISDAAIFVYLQMFTDYLQKGDAIEQLVPLTEELMKLFFYGIAGNGEIKKPD